MALWKRLRRPVALHGAPLHADSTGALPAEGRVWQRPLPAVYCATSAIAEPPPRKAGELDERVRE